jgi:hypothetical protein
MVGVGAREKRIAKDWAGEDVPSRQSVAVKKKKRKDKKTRKITKRRIGTQSKKEKSRSPAARELKDRLATFDPSFGR